MLFDGHEPEASLEYLRMFPCAKSIIDAGTCRDSVLAVASEVDYLVCSESFASQYLGHQLSWGCEELAEDLASLQRIHGGEVIVTRGEGGLVYLSRGTSVAMPAFEVDAVDTTGAGDIFHGALAYGLDIDMELRDCLLLASMTAAISVTRCGGQTSIPPLDAVLHGLEHAGAPIDLRVLSSHQD